jgi:cytochrome P450
MNRVTLLAMSVLDDKGIPAPPNAGPWPPPQAVEGRSGPPPHLLELGHLRPLFSEGPLDAYLRWAKQERRDFVVWAGPRPHVVVIEPESIREVLLGGEQLFCRNSHALANMFGESILRLDGEPWRRRRAIYASAFRGEALGRAVGIIQDETEALIASWAARGGSQAFKPARSLSTCMLRILGRFLFGVALDAAATGREPLHRALVVLASDAVARHFLPEPLVSLRNAGPVARARSQLDALCVELLEGDSETPFLAALRGGLARGELDRITVIDELRTFLIAGHETSATALAWALALLAEHPERAAFVRREGEAAASMTTPDELGALEHSTRWVKETMRLYPAVPLATSQAAQDVRLGRLEIPRGTRVDVCSYVQHRLPWLWSAPARFEPDRFSQPAPFGTFLPFLLGPHTCIGLQLAMIELPLVLARLAASFEFELPAGPPRPNLRVSLHPAGLVVRARPRRPPTRVSAKDPRSAAGACS